MAAANMKDVKRRIRSVESTKQITRAMELVASSKLRRAKEMALAVQPFFETLYDIMSDISSDRTFKSVYTKKKSEKSTLLIVIAGDRGLAGGYNTNVLKTAERRIRKLESDNERVSVMAIGKKSAEYFDKRGYDLVGRYDNIAESLDIYETMDIAEEIIDRFRCSDFGRVELVYTTFVSALTQQPVEVSLLPVEHMENGGGKTSSLTEYDPSPEEVFDGIVPQYLCGALYAAIVDSYASEQAARRTAMESASDNADEMIDQLSLLYNRARQAQITQEINEISAGSLRDE